MIIKTTFMYEDCVETNYTNIDLTKLDHNTLLTSSNPLDRLLGEVLSDDSITDKMITFLQEAKKISDTGEISEYLDEIGDPITADITIADSMYRSNISGVYHGDTVIEENGTSIFGTKVVDY